MRLCAILTLAALAAIVLPVHATTYRVDVGGGGDFIDIWGAVVASVTGDTILVAPGTYTGAQNRNIDPSGKNIVFLAEGGGRIPVTIDCEGLARAFIFQSGEDASTLVRGFTIINGYESSSGGAMSISNSSPTIENCVFRDCSADLNGGAFTMFNSASVVSSCVFRGNEAGLRGGAVYTYHTTTTFTGCLFDENTLGDPGPGDHTGGALYLNDGGETVTECTVVENDFDQIDLQGFPDVFVSNCVIANSIAGVGVSASAAENGTVTHCVLFGNAGGDTPECDHFDNIYHDPLFCDDTIDDYTYCDDSFAVWYNNAYQEQIGAYESGCPPCGTAVEPTSWGVMKALFR